MSDLFFNLNTKVKLPEFIILDTDILSDLYRERDLLRELINQFPQKTFLVDGFCRFEFLRDNFLPDVFQHKNDFLKSLCIETENHNDTLQIISDFAESISQIYAWKGLAGKASFVDIHLAARCLKFSSSVVLLTANMKDYPRFIFDRIGIINFQGDKTTSQQMKSYGILLPNINSYRRLLNEMKRNKI